MDLDTLVIDGLTGESFAFSESNVDYLVWLDPAPLAADGTFAGSEVRVDKSGYPLAASSGTWGGRLSGIADPDGVPRLAAGTFGASFESSGQTEGAFIGVFVGGERPSYLVIE